MLRFGGLSINHVHLSDFKLDSIAAGMLSILLAVRTYYNCKLERRSRVKELACVQVPIRLCYAIHQVIGVFVLAFKKKKISIFFR